MKLYKYRALELGANPLRRIEQILTSKSFWCSRVDTLNDADEFDWKLDCTPTATTIELVAELLVRSFGRDPAVARERAAKAVVDGRLEALARPLLEGTIERCRTDFGLSCFGSTPSNPSLWRSYGGDGNGVCIEVDVPDRLIGAQLHPVTYVREKTIHVDAFLRSQWDTDTRLELYIAMLATKRDTWRDEAEVRFISKLPDVSVRIDDSRLSCLYVGPMVTPQVCAQLAAVVASLQHSLRVESLAPTSVKATFSAHA